MADTTYSNEINLILPILLTLTKNIFTTYGYSTVRGTSSLTAICHDIQVPIRAKIQSKLEYSKTHAIRQFLFGLKLK